VGVAYHGAMQQLSRQAQDTVELWKTYDKNQIKVRDVEVEDLAEVHQRIVGGVNVTTTDTGSSYILVLGCLLRQWTLI